MNNLTSFSICESPINIFIAINNHKLFYYFYLFPQFMFKKKNTNSNFHINVHLLIIARIKTTLHPGSLPLPRYRGRSHLNCPVLKFPEGNKKGITTNCYICIFDRLLFHGNVIACSRLSFLKGSLVPYKRHRYLYRTSEICQHIWSPIKENLHTQ